METDGIHLDPSQQTDQPSKPSTKKLSLTTLLAIGVILIVLAGFYWLREDNSPTESLLTNTPNDSVPLVKPQLQTQEVVSGHSNIWDVVYPNENTMIYTVRAGELWGYSLTSNDKWQIAKLDQVRAEGEGGLLGLAIDSQFDENRFVYACYNSTSSPPTVRVARFKLSDDSRTLSDWTEIIPDIESQAGRHSGCRLAMDNQNVLWVGTGDSALRSAPQNPKSLAGKVLRVDRDGKAVAGNLAAPFDSRIYSYGHRNIQGLVLLDNPLANGAVGYTSEHGPGKDDEINYLLPGNFGWDPAGSRPGYDESVPMTDTVKYPDAIQAIWTSGNPTIAPSGLAILTGEKWSAWGGRIVMAVLKDKHVRLIEFDANGTVVSEEELFKNEFGRIRSVRVGPHSDLYITTDNGANRDGIIRLSPSTL